MTVSSLRIALATATVWMTAAEATTLPVNITYACDGGQKAVAAYKMPASQGGAIGNYRGNTFNFKVAKTGSGVRYTTGGGIHDIAPVEWWAKGSSATLSELTPNGDRRRLIATCLATR
jgi:membrane-bound inhibitor of C-type lysozyme